jgi:hypothetical protein
MTLNYNCWGKEFHLALREDRYSSNGSLYLGLVDVDDMEPFADLTVNLADGMATESCQYVDTNNLAGIQELIEENNLGMLIGYGHSGFCTYPLYVFDKEEYSKYLLGGQHND